MKALTTVLTMTALATLGCGGSTPDSADATDTVTAHAEMPADDAHGMPDDDVHAQAMGSMGGGMHMGGGVNAEVTIDPEIADDWRAITVRLVDLADGTETLHEIPIGGEAALGDSGLTLRPLTFIPDFVMGDGGITSRSTEPVNPAARVIITEQGKPDYEGWLFAAMPEIHAFPHDAWGVVLVAGVPAE